MGSTNKGERPTGRTLTKGLRNNVSTERSLKIQIIKDPATPPYLRCAAPSCNGEVGLIPPASSSRGCCRRSQSTKNFSSRPDIKVAPVPHPGSESVKIEKRLEKIRNKLRRQGINGPEPALLYGNTQEMKRIRQEIRCVQRQDTNMNNYISIIFPHFLHWRKTYEPVFLYSTGAVEILHVAQLEMVKDMGCWTTSELEEPHYLMRSRKPLLGEGILSANGDLWAYEKKILAPKFFMEKIKVAPVPHPGSESVKIEKRLEKIRNKLRRQGINGPEPALLYGITQEMKRIGQEISLIYYVIARCLEIRTEPVFLYSTGAVEILHVAQPEMVKDMGCWTTSELAKPHYLMRSRKPLLGEGILSANGDLWAYEKKILAPKFFMEKIKVINFT
ncbi:hypothetical protein C2845_PM09G14280 [Panicum miliaceum]|uniref:Uncharacterized protein n=1 Tax=Panicum miliaceum TaxID=4540 RepID=A0A3L6S0I4_PANMI|nr:hypothetical protein C2845_PM09G14280 [Panicum miliaceum]